jgi:hypothetical protein
VRTCYFADDLYEGYIIDTRKEITLHYHASLDRNCIVWSVSVPSPIVKCCLGMLTEWAHVLPTKCFDVLQISLRTNLKGLSMLDSRPSAEERSYETPASCPCAT